MPSPKGYVKIGRKNHQHTCPHCEGEFLGTYNQIHCDTCKDAGVGGYKPTNTPVVYMLYTDEDERVYIGSSTNFEARLNQHCLEGEDTTSKRLVGEIKGKVLATLKTKREMLFFEQFVLLHLPPEMVVNEN